MDAHDSRYAIGTLIHLPGLDAPPAFVAIATSHRARARREVLRVPQSVRRVAMDMQTGELPGAPHAGLQGLVQTAAPPRSRPPRDVGQDGRAGGAQGRAARPATAPCGAPG